MATAEAKSKRSVGAKTSGAGTGAKRPLVGKQDPKPARLQGGTQHVIERGGRTYVLEGRSIFEDLGFSQEESRPWVEKAFDEVLQQRNEVKTALVDAARDQILSLGLNTSQAADYLSMTRPRVSDILNRKFEKVSIDAVVDVVHKFGKELRIQVVDRASADSGPRTGKATAKR